MHGPFLGKITLEHKGKKLTGKWTAIILWVILANDALASEQNQTQKTITPSCYILAEITFWESTSHLSKKDKKRAEEVIKFSRSAPGAHSPDHESYIEEARLRGKTSHGNAGEGHTDFEAAREDALAAAFMTLSLCLAGELEGYKPGRKLEQWWLDK